MKKRLLVNKKLSKLTYVESRYLALDARRKNIEHFNTFECSDFFKGKVVAAINRKEYYKKIKPVWREMHILETIMERLKGKAL